MCDVSCAFLYADIKRLVYIELPTEDPSSINGSMVGTLEKALYGTRDAPQAWHDELSRTLAPQVCTPTSGWRWQWLHMWMICSVAAKNLEWVRADLQKNYEVMGRVMVEGNSEIKFLGRIIARNEHGRKTPST